MRKLIFKKGDKVRLIPDTSIAARIGAEAIVTKDFYYDNSEPDAWLNVKWVGPLSNGQRDGNYWPNVFVKVSNRKFKAKTVSI